MYQNLYSNIPIIDCLTTFDKLVCVPQFITQMYSDVMGLNEFYYK